jgi:hypothetical protein
MIFSEAIDAIGEAQFCADSENISHAVVVEGDHYGVMPRSDITIERVLEVCHSTAPVRSPYHDVDHSGREGSSSATSTWGTKRVGQILCGDSL